MPSSHRATAAAAFTATLFLLATLPVAAQTAASDARRGLELAQKLCANCHIVAPNSAAAANPDVPTFAAIAARPDSTAERLAGRIIVPHPAMPAAQPTIAELRDVIAYIQSLKPAQ